MTLSQQNHASWSNWPCSWFFKTFHHIYPSTLEGSAWVCGLRWTGLCPAVSVTLGQKTDAVYRQWWIHRCEHSACSSPDTEGQETLVWRQWCPQFIQRVLMLKQAIQIKLEHTESANWRGVGGGDKPARCPVSGWGCIKLHAHPLSMFEVHWSAKSLWECGSDLPTPPKGMLGRVMWMIPSLEQNPPLLVFSSTVFTTSKQEREFNVK